MSSTRGRRFGGGSRRRTLAVIAAVALLAGAAGSPVEPAAAVNTIDWLDHSFGDGLQAFNLSGGKDPAAGIAVQADGKVLVAATADEDAFSAGSSGKIVVLRFLPDGRPDAAFGTAGKAVVERAGIERTIGLAIQGDGRIVVGAEGEIRSGLGSPPVGFFFVARLDAAGQLDTTFSDSHVAAMVQKQLTVDFTALSLAPDGKVVVAGPYQNRQNASGLIVVRLDPDGSFDEGFGDGGFLVRQPPAGYQYWSEAVAAVGVRPDASIIVGGTVRWPSQASGLPVSAWFLITRITPAGALDPGFGDHGSVYTDVAGGSGTRQSHLLAMTFQGDGKMVASGKASRSDSGFDGQVVVRYLADGRLDPGFGSSGIVMTLAPASSQGGSLAYGGAVASAVAVDPRGRIVTGGSAAGYLSADMALTRYTPTGMVDRTFGRAGWMKIERETQSDGIAALALQPDGRTVFAGCLDTCSTLGLGRIAAWDTSTTTKAWGWNPLGQLGDDSATQRNIPVPTPGSGTTVAPAGGGYHSLNLRGDGVVLSSGWNGVGQLGDGTTKDRDTFAPVPGLDNVTGIAAGGNHSLAISDGRVYAWGWNALGQLGDGTTTDRHTPVLVPGLSNVVQVSAGAYHSLALLRDGTIWAWGWNGVGQLGDGTTIDRRRPVQVSGMHAAVDISAGALHSLAVGAGPPGPNPAVWAWGWNGMGQADPLNAGVPVMPLPRELWAGRPIAIAAGGYHNVIIGGDGDLHTWGWNALGQLGNGTTDPALLVTVSAIPDPVSISAGGAHTMATDSSGRTWAWGWNAMGQLGDGTTTDRSSPVLVPGAQGAVALSGGWYHSMGAVASG